MRFRRKGVPAAAIMLVLVVISSSLVACKTEQFTSTSLNPTQAKNSVNPENTSGSDYKAETEVIPNLENRSELTSISSAHTEFSLDLTNPSVTFGNVIINIKSDRNIVDALEGQILELNFSKTDMTNSSSGYTHEQSMVCAFFYCCRRNSHC
ncbi:MAG TPA: hypothetical protein PK604_15520 [Acetivibrio clariflavus]|nr:hypothetical protein [Acetivibrio clariflavus]